MQIQNHIAKISWTLADKVLYVIYGFVFLIQISLLTPENIALFNFLIAFNTWIFVISDSFALQSIIQYGFDKENQSKVNSYAGIMHLLVIGVLSGLVYISRYLISDMFSEPRFLEIIVFLPVLSLLMIPRTFCLKLMLRDQAMHKIFFANFIFFGVMVFRIISFKLTKNTIGLDDAIYIYLEGVAFSSLAAVLMTLRQIRFSLKGKIQIKKIMSFSLPFTLTNSVNTFTKYLDYFLLKLFFPLDQIGLYTAARSLFKFFEEGMNGVNGLIYPAAVRAASNNDKPALQSMITKAISFTLIGYVFLSLALSLGLAEIMITFFMKLDYLESILHFKIMLIATLFLPFNILYFVITASGRHYELLKIVSQSFAVSVLSFILIGLSGESILMPIGYVTFYCAFAIRAFFFVNNHQIISLKFSDLFRAFGDSYKFVQKLIAGKR
ncbi:MAG: oligosaccharide flippase family protein [Candidatus Kapabacteria bacterium]|nr:oligosaccharide flippase family protein [Candidatus Kapabacteria bacterium]